MVTSTEVKDTAFDRQRDSKGRYLPGKGPWQPGQSGNPTGRPPGIKYISERLRELLAKDAGNGKTKADLVAEVILEGILDSASNLKHGINTPLVRELLDRIEGKVPTPVSIGGLGGGPVEILVRYDDEAKETEVKGK